MYLDAGLVFSSAQAITATAVSTGVVDLAGLGSGVAMSNIYGNAVNFGEDIGIGDGPMIPRLWVSTGPTAWGALTSLNVQIQGAPDTAPGTPGTPGTWVTYAESGTVLTAALLANTVIFRIAVPAIQPEGGPMPRFLRLNYVVAGSNATTATISAYINLHQQQWQAKFYPNNYQVA